MRYHVDGQWKDLELITKEIKIKDKDPVTFDVKYTHRGPLLTATTIKNAQVLFGN
jgi:acyl-homoserine lactone acylase PvdQ